MRTSINIGMAIKKLVGGFIENRREKPRDQSEVMSLGKFTIASHKMMIGIKYGCKTHKQDDTMRITNPTQ